MSILRLISITVVSFLLNFGCVAEAEEIVPEQLETLDGVTGTPSQLATIERIRKLVRIVSAMCANIYPKLSETDCFEKAYSGVMSHLDQHSAYFNKEKLTDFRSNTRRTFTGIGVEIMKKKNGQIRVLRVFDGPAKAVDMREGDIITHINGVKLSEQVLVEEAKDLMRGASGTSVTVTFVRNASTQQLERQITRQAVKIPNVELEIIEENGLRYGIALIPRYSLGLTIEMREKIIAETTNGKKLDRFIMVKTGNPGGLLSEGASLPDLFIDIDAASGVILKTREVASVYGSSPHEALYVVKTPGDILEGVPIAIVVGPVCASACELATKLLQKVHRVTVIGENCREGEICTYGKGLIQTILQVSKDSAISVTSGEYFVGTAESHIPVQCIGVIPDIYIPPETEELRKALRERTTECSDPKSLKSLGVEVGSSPHTPMRSYNPLAYAQGEEMARVYTRWEKQRRDEYMRKFNE